MASEPLDALVRRVDEDRWLASRFARADVRAKLVALYALNYEIARAPEGARDPVLATMRLTWWRDALAEIAAGKPPRAHPALEGYASSGAAALLGAAAWDALFDARARDVEEMPFATWGDLEAYLEATAGAVFRLAIAACAETSVQAEAFTKSAAHAWGYAGLLRALPFWTQRGRSFFPRESEGAREPAATMLDRGRRAYADARELAPLLPSTMFPAIGYLAFSPAYFRALTAGKDGGLPLLNRQLALLTGALTGRV